MKVVLTALTAAALGLAGTSFYLSRELSSERARAASASDEVARLRASLGAMARTAVPTAPTNSSADPAGAAAPRAERAASEVKPDPAQSSIPGAMSKELIAELEKRGRIAKEEQRHRFADPARRALMRAAAVEALRQRNFDLAHAMGITDAQVDKLYALLAEQQLKRAESGQSWYGAPGTPEQIAIQERERQQIASLLGDDGAQRLAAYQEAADERSMVMWYRTQLSADAMLSDDQVARLTADLHDEKKQFDADRNAQLAPVAGQPYQSISAGYAGMLSSTASSPDELQKQMEAQLVTYRQRMHDRAAGVLTQGQLKTFDMFLDGQVASGRLSIRDIRDRLPFEAKTGAAAPK